MPSRHLTALRAALVVVGLVALALYPLFHWWPSGFRWHPPHPEYEQMLAALYATLGVFLLRAARAPLRHLSLIWFTVWSSVAHAAIMAVHAWPAPHEHGHLVGDIPLLLVAALVLGGLTWRVTHGTRHHVESFHEEDTAAASNPAAEPR